jgi:hypothetical protein
MRLLALPAVAVAVAVAALALSAPAAAAATPATTRAVAPHASTLTTATSSETPIPVALSNVAPATRRLSSDAVLAIANRLPKMRALRREYRGSFGDVYEKGAFQWQVSYFTRNGKKEIGLVAIDDLSGRVVEQWTGFQVIWTMARGYPGAFGRHVNALYIWLPLCVLFMLPFFDFRRPFSMLHLDLLVLLSFSVSLAFFNHAHIYASVPLAYPPLLYLLARMLALLRRGSGSRPPGVDPTDGSNPRPLRLLVPAPWLALGVVFLLGFRVALNVTDSNVIDVGYAGVIGAQRIVDGRPLYGGYPADNEHGDTYGPFNYEAYVPFEQIFGWSGTWDDLPAAHAAAIFFDLLATALMFLLGRRMRGPTLGVALAYAWVSYPFTLYALESNANDTLLTALVLAAALAASYRSKRALSARGGLAALAGLTKFAPLVLAPLLATHGLAEGAGRAGSGRAGSGRAGSPSPRALRVRALAPFAAAFLGTAALVCIPAFSHDSLHTIFERTLVYQSNRGSPFSVWGLYGLHGLERIAEIAAAALAIALAVIPRRADLVGLAAACAAAILAVQLGIEHWFYLYIPWFFPLVIIALLGRFSDPAKPLPAAASAPAQWSRRATAVSS